jgi:hypothetical protein
VGVFGFIFAIIIFIIILSISFPLAASISSIIFISWIIGWKLSIFVVLLTITISKPKRFYKAWISNFINGDNKLRKYHLSGERIGKFIVQDGIAIDTETGLTWCRFAHGQTWKDGKAVGEATAVNWMTAFSVANKQGGYENYTDWRLPTCDELKTLAHPNKGINKRYITINTDVFSKPEESSFSTSDGGWFWSSTPEEKGFAKVFVFGLFSPRECSVRTGNCYYVRLVRGKLNSVNPA